MADVKFRLISGLVLLGPLIGVGTSMAAEFQGNPFRETVRQIKPLHERKAAPGPNDWLATHDETGQTFGEYWRSGPNRPTKNCTTLYLQPIGEFHQTHHQLVEQTAEFLSRFYHLQTKALDPLELNVIPPEARRVHPTWGDLQILTTYVLDKVLKPRRPRDAVAMLALTTSDLWPGKGWNFVFGQASLRDRVGVWSLYRYGEPDRGDDAHRQFRRRMFKVAVHETGHMLGITHCAAYECGMNGSNHLAEMDRRPLWFCPECVQKIWWACDADPTRRYESLIEFAKQHGLKTEADFWRKSLDRLRE